MSPLVAQFRESNALHAERDGELAAMMEVVGDDVPQRFQGEMTVASKGFAALCSWP